MREKMTVKELLSSGVRVSKSPPKSLKLVWLKEVAGTTGRFVAPLTGKQEGQLRQFANRCPDPDKAAEVLAYVIEHWLEFSKEAEVAAGLKTSPAVPDPGFLLKHVAVAANMWIDHQKAPAMQEAKPVTTFAHDLVQSIAQKPTPEEDAPETLDDLLSILGTKG